MSLFLKVFLWFWLAMALVIVALFAVAYVTRPELPGPRPPQFIDGVMTAYARSAVEIFEREGAAGLDSFLQRFEREADIRGRLFDASGRELTGNETTTDERELAARVAGGSTTASQMMGGKLIEARIAPARSGARYVLVATLPLGPPPFAANGAPPPLDANKPSLLGAQGPPPNRPPRFGPFNMLFGESVAAFIARIIAVILTAGVLCYGMARYIVSPVIKLREATRQVARGDLSARVGPALGKRRDELAAMGRDFDTMAARLEALVSAQGRLLRDISHELRSPLARLSVALDLARKRAGPEAASHLARIEREAGRLNEMIGQLLTISRRETGAGALRRELVDLAALVREVAEDADFEARSRNRTVSVVECDACEMKGTATLLRSAFENVVRNAVRHAPDETKVQVSLRCRRTDAESHAVLTVRDEGAGVPAEALTDIFRPFYRVDDARDRESGGAGLGLAITERAAQLHGGTVTASNVAGGGFVVEIRLPLEAETATPTN